MNKLVNSNRLVKQVAGRLQAINFARTFYICTMAAAGVYAVLLLINRLLSLIPDWFDPWTVAAIPAVVAYNKFSTDLGRYSTRLDAFVGEFSAILSRQLEERHG